LMPQQDFSGGGGGTPYFKLQTIREEGRRGVGGEKEKGNPRTYFEDKQDDQPRGVRTLGQKLKRGRDKEALLVILTTQKRVN